MKRMTKSPVPDAFPASEYSAWVESLKTRVREAQTRASLAVNRELVLLYWSIGSEILERQKLRGWGTKVLERLAADMKVAFPDMTGLSRTNLAYMLTFAQAWPDVSIVQQLVGQLPWGHNIALLDRLDAQEARLWYARQAIENGWSRAVLVHQIELRLMERQGSAVTNFAATLPSAQSELAQQLTK